MLDLIAGARHSLRLSIFRCHDEDVLGALAAAVCRGVVVEALLTPRASGGRKRLRHLAKALSQTGARVHQAPAVAKYHAKYAVADARVALVATHNATRKCFTRSCDFAVTTSDPDVVRSLSTLFALDAAGRLPGRRHAFSPRLVIGPDGARARMRALIAGATSSIDVLDHKLSDPEMLALLLARRAAGVDVSVIAGALPHGLVSHGKLVIVDRRQAVFGSLALSPRSLDVRREVSIVIDRPALVEELIDFYRGLRPRAATGWPPATSVRAA